MKHITVSTRYRHKLKPYRFGLKIALLMGVFHYTLVAIFRHGEYRFYLFPIWFIVIFFTQFLLRKITIEGVVDMSKYFLVYPVGPAGAIPFLILGQWLCRWVWPYGFIDTPVIVFAGDVVAIYIDVALVNLFFMARMFKRRYEFESKLYTQLGKRLVMNLRSLDNWEDIRIESERLFPGLVDQIGRRCCFSPMQIRMVTYMKLGFSPNKIATIEGISPETLRKRRERIRDRVEKEADMKLSDFLDQIY